MTEKKRPTVRRRHREEAMMPRRHTKKLVVGCVVVLAVATLATVGVVNAANKAARPSVEPAFAELPDYDDVGTYVQGCTTDGNGNAYVVKQRKGARTNIQRIDLQHGGSTQVSMTKDAAKAVGHGNDLAYVETNGAKYLLAAPARSTHYLVVLKLDGDKASLHGKVQVSENVVDAVQKVAVEGVSGNKAKVILGKGGVLKRVTVDLKAMRKVTKGDALFGFSSVCDQSLTIEKVGGVTYLYGCHGGWLNSTGCAIKYELHGHKLKKIWERPVAGEPQAVIPWNSKVLVFLEGNTQWGTRHNQEFTDRIIQWNK